MIEELKKYFKNRTDVAFAFLFGSQANGKATQGSDVDVAVYFYPTVRIPTEFEADIHYKSENEIWGALQILLRKEVELLVLNRAPACVAASALRGIPLVIQDWGLYLDFMENITDVEEDFAEMVITDYCERNALEKRD